MDCESQTKSENFLFLLILKEKEIVKLFNRKICNSENFKLKVGVYFISLRRKRVESTLVFKAVEGDIKLCRRYKDLYAFYYYVSVRHLSN